MEEEEYSLLRENVEERRKVTLLGRKRACSPKAECWRISKADLAEGNEEVEEDIGWKGTGEMVRRLSGVVGSSVSLNYYRCIRIIVAASDMQLLSISEHCALLYASMFCKHIWQRRKKAM